MVLSVKNKHPIYGKREIVTFELRKDGWYYSSIGYRFHATVRKNKTFDMIWDLEKINEDISRRG